MIAKSEGRILTVNGKVIETRVKSLTFTVDGSKFPINAIQDACSIYFQSEGNNSVEVSYGDGTFENFNFGNFSGNKYRAGHTLYGVPSAEIPSQCLIQPHIYQDGNSGQRLVTFTFQYPERITGIISNSVRLFGYFPVEIGEFSSLEILNITWARYLIDMPESIAKCKNLKDLTFEYCTSERLPKIPDAFFEIVGLRRFLMSGSLDLSDNISSNFFKINQLKSLDRLFLGNCLIKSLPEEISELSATLLDLRLISNTPEVPFEHIDTLNKMAILSLQAPINKQFQNLSSLNRLAQLQLGGDWDFTSIGWNWAGLYALSTISELNLVFATNAKSNEFVNHFYDLVRVQGSIVTNGSPQPYPNRFRNIAWGSGNLIFTGAKVAPTGYVQGVSNGAPTTSGQKVYVLQNQYNHTITHAPPL